MKQTFLCKERRQRQGLEQSTFKSKTRSHALIHCPSTFIPILQWKQLLVKIIMLYFVFQDPPVKPTAGKICVFNPNLSSAVDCDVDISRFTSYFLTFSFKAVIMLSHNRYFVFKKPEVAQNSETESTLRFTTMKSSPPFSLRLQLIIVHLSKFSQHLFKLICGCLYKVPEILMLSLFCRYSKYNFGSQKRR